MNFTLPVFTIGATSASWLPLVNINWRQKLVKIYALVPFWTNTPWESLAYSLYRYSQFKKLELPFSYPYMFCNSLKFVAVNMVCEGRQVEDWVGAVCLVAGWKKKCWLSGIEIFILSTSDSWLLTINFWFSTYNTLEFRLPWWTVVR